MKQLLKFLLLVVALNLVRYGVGGPIEYGLVLRKLFAAMEANASCFNTQFSTFDWVTSYFYNFLMWLTCTWVFVLMHPVLRGGYVVRSLKVFALMYLFFLSLSAIYMNHYRHPKDFYFWNVLDGVIEFALVAAVNGLLYPALFRGSKTPG